MSCLRSIPHLVLLLVAAAHPSLRAGPAPFTFTRLVAHWSDYGSPEYLKFIEDARPEIAQVGFYGAHFWSLAHTEAYGGYPANFPLRGLAELGGWFEDLNRKLHERGAKVVGHFNVEFLVGDPDGPQGPRGFFKFYRDLWDEQALGPKPVDDPIQLLEKNADGTPISNQAYGIGGMKEYWACLRNPAWQAVLRAWVRAAIRRGVDGLVINYFYRHNCLCEHCQSAFRRYLREQFTAEELHARLGIEALDSHRFGEIVSWHPAGETTPLRLEMLRFSQISNKEVFDEVFVKHGRSLKPDLLVGQWNHLGNFNQVNGDERCLLPAELWGRDESYLWYSTGGAAHYTDLAEGMLGEGTLQARYIRGMFGNKPFTLGKYESTRIRASIAELAANGGAPMGFYTSFKDPLARAEIVRYYRFLAANDAIYRDNRPRGEVALLFPRRRIHRGDAAAVEAFRQLGQRLLETHVLFDVFPDDAFPEEVARRYPCAVAPGDSVETVLERLPPARSRFTCPFTVRVSASQPARSEKEIDLHFVNYNRTEPPRGADGQPSPGGGIADEKPVPVSGMAADVALPAGATLREARFIAPEEAAPRKLDVSVQDGRARFVIPEILVYGAVQILLD
jgi:hypothetical protein